MRDWHRATRPLAALSLALLTLGGGLHDGAAHAQATTSTYTVRPNDTLSGIALAFGTTVSALLRANNLTDADGLVVGQILVVQGGREGGDHRRQVDDQANEGAAPPVTEQAATPASVPTGSSSLYIVRPGDTLSGIGQRFGLSAGALIRANPQQDLSPLRVGVRLSVPAPGSAPAQPTATAQESGSTAPAASTPQAPIAQSGSVATLLTAQAQAAGISAALLKAVAWQESGWHMVTAADGGIGIMQLMPATVDWLSTSLLGYRLNPYNAAENIHGGAVLLAYYLRILGNQGLAIAAYNGGLGSVQAGTISAPVARYVANVLALEQRFSS